MGCLLRQGSFFGEIALVHGGQRTASVAALSRCELLELKLDAAPEAPEAAAGPSPPSAGSLSDEPSAPLSAAAAPAAEPADEELPML